MRLNKKIFNKILKIFLLLLAAAGVYAYYVYEISDNFKPVVEKKVYRSAQPDKETLVSWLDQYNFKTIINLRGPTSDFAEMETEICKQNDVDIYHVKMNAYKKIPSNVLIDLVDTIDKIKTPVLLHCRQGVDRSGTASALAAWLLGLEPYEKAKSHSYVLPGPWKYKNGFDHVSDIFKDYEHFCKEENLIVDDTEQFKHWARNTYHPDYFYVGYKAKSIVTTSPNSKTNIDVTITNLSEEIIPAGKSSRKFRVISRLKLNDKILEPREKYFQETLLDASDLKPGETTHITHTLNTPTEPGTYQFYLDMCEKEDHSFARQGSPVFEGVLVVDNNIQIAMKKDKSLSN